LGDGVVKAPTGDEGTPGWLFAVIGVGMQFFFLLVFLFVQQNLISRC
jgi:hypothetical protein